MAAEVLRVGSRKGWGVGRSDEARQEWEWSGPHFDMEEVYACMVDTRCDPPRLLAGAASSWLGPQAGRPDDLGARWQSTTEAIRFHDDVDAPVGRVWQPVTGAGEGAGYSGTDASAWWPSPARRSTFADRQSVGWGKGGQGH